MKKVNITTRWTMLLIILIFGLTGCGSIEDKSDISISSTSAISKINESNIPDTSTAHVTVMPTKPSIYPSGDNVKFIDYNQYLKKIWVVKSWNGGAYDYYSFFISKIENGVIEGKISIGSIAYPDFFFYSLEPTKYLGDISGKVNNSEAECEFSNKVGNKGSLTLVFKEKGEIEAKITCMDKGEAYKDLSLDGNYIFRPYNLTDIENITPLEEHSFAEDLNSWGSVNFVSGESDTGKVVHPVAYLTNEHDDILYEFKAPFQTGTEIIDASAKDINKDGLKDVMIVTAFTEDPDIEHIEWIFLQRDDGLFYDSDLVTN